MTIDIFPAIAELVGAPLPERTIDGQSIWPLLSGASAESPQEAYFFYYRTNELHAMRSGRWKLQFPHTYRTMQGREAGRDGIPGKYDYGVATGLALYDLRRDIGESVNLADSLPDVVAALIRLADAQRGELGDALMDVEGRGLREPGRIQ
mgnify:CR=1 FL=1